MLRNFLSPSDELGVLLQADGFQEGARGSVPKGTMEYCREYQFDNRPQPRRWRFDFVFDLQVAVEVDGGTWGVYGGKRCLSCGRVPTGAHSRGGGYQNDCHKANVATLQGWSLLRFTPADIKRGEALRTICTALGLKNARERGRP